MSSSDRQPKYRQEIQQVSAFPVPISNSKSRSCGRVAVFWYIVFRSGSPSTAVNQVNGYA